MAPSWPQIVKITQNRRRKNIPKLVQNGTQLKLQLKLKLPHHWANFFLNTQNNQKNYEGEKCPKLLQIPQNGQKLCFPKKYSKLPHNCSK